MKYKKILYLIALAVLMVNRVTTYAQEHVPHVVHVNVTNNSLLENCNAQICIAYDGTIGNSPVSGTICMNYSPTGNYSFEITWGFTGRICPYLVNDCNYVAEEVSCFLGILGREATVSFKVGGEPIE